MSAVLQFFGLSFVLSWACFLGAAAMTNGSAAAPITVMRGALYLLGVFAPALVALGLTARVDGRVGVRGLLRQMLHWRVDWRLYLFAVTYMAAIKLAVALIHRVATGGWPRFGHDAWYTILVATLIATPVQAGEEIGWRGYALPRLAGQFGLARASLLLGVVWGCWHLPFFFVPGTDKFGQSFPAYLLQVTALSVAAAWLYWRAQRSLLLVMTMHSAVNQTLGIVPSTVPNASNAFALSTSLVAWLTVGLLSICAVCFLLQMRTSGPRDWLRAADVAEVRPGVGGATEGVER